MTNEIASTDDSTDELGLGVAQTIYGFLKPVCPAVCPSAQALLEIMSERPGRGKVMEGGDRRDNRGGSKGVLRNHKKTSTPP